MAARVLLVGGDPLVVLNCTEQTEFIILDVIVDRAWEFQETKEKNLSTEIANKLGKMMP